MAAWATVTSCAEPTRSTSSLTRLVTLMNEAEIECPLQKLSAASSIDELGGVESVTLWDEDFENQQHGVTVLGNCRQEFDERRRSFILSCRNEGRARVTIQGEPLTHYLIRFSGMQNRPLGYTVRVTEHSAEKALKIYKSQDFSQQWSSIELWFRSTPSTRYFEIEFQSEHSKAILNLDKISVDRIELTQDQETRLLMAEKTHSQWSAPPGMVKRGLLLPLCDPEDVDSEFIDNYGIRDAIFAPPVTKIKFPIRVPRDARLSLALALSEKSSPDAAVQFQVIADLDNQRHLLLDETISLTQGNASRWHERTISLAEFSDRDITLTLETHCVETAGRLYPFWGSPEIHAPHRSDEPPPIVLIAVDTLRADRLACYGYKSAVSPTIDKLARDGIRFDAAISSANWTAPAFVSLFTGRPVPDLPEGLRGAPETTLAEHLQKAGYATAAIAFKPMLFDNGFDRGFDFFLNAPRYAVRAEHNVSRALEWLHSNGDRRFFLFLHLNDPHQPFCQPESGVDAEVVQRLRNFGLSLPIMVYGTKAKGIDLQNPTLSIGRSRECSSCRTESRLIPEFKELAGDLYDDAVSYADTNIALVIEYLQDSGVYDDAVVAFFSDHGETLWSHGEHYAHGRDNLHDELIRVPLIIKPPKSYGWPAGLVVHQQVRLFDLMPTLLQFAEVPIPPMAAQSLAPGIRGPGSSQFNDRPAFSISRKPNTLSLRYGEFKFIRYYPKTQGEDLREALFDLRLDPKENTDVLHAKPEVLDRYRLMMDEQLLAYGSGRLVLITGDPGTRYTVRIRWNQETRLGLFPQPGITPGKNEGEHIWEYSGSSSRGVVFLTSFIPTDDAGVRIEVTSDQHAVHRAHFGPNDVPIYRDGDLERLNSLPGVQMAVFDGKQYHIPRSGFQESTDARKLDALRALGYVQ